MKWRGEKGVSQETQKLHQISPFPASASFLPNATQYQARRVRCASGRGDAQGQVLSGTAWVAGCRADGETVTPGSRQGWRRRGSSEHAWGGEPKLLKKGGREEEGGGNKQALT